MITPELLKTWNPCADGYKRFLQLFPEGAELDIAIDVLVKDNHDDWGYWLFSECKSRGLYKNITSLGYRNSGDWNSGNRNSGYRNSGDWNSGNRNSGNWNSGDWNSGDWNSGDWNSGNWNSGDRNSGYWNSGNWNSGYRNSGYWNSGNWNSGNWNSGDWNSGDWNSGFFNVDMPRTVRVFGVQIEKVEWDKCYKPSFLQFSISEWITIGAMTDVDKINHPDYDIVGGYLKVRPYKDAFMRSWEQADPADRIRIKDVPGFNADMFFEISGIDLREKKP